MDDVDTFVDPSGDDGVLHYFLNEDVELSWGGMSGMGRCGFDDPLHPEEIRLHPIEAVFERRVMEEIREQSIRACEVGGEWALKETGGFLGGHLCRDGKGRVFSHITYNSSREGFIGEKDSLRFGLEEIGEFTAAILEKNLVPCGFWHSHPSYAPFQSDPRIGSYGADVPATNTICNRWWDVSMVVDPFLHDEALLGSLTADRDMMVSCFKMLEHSAHEKEEGSRMGYRSIGFAVLKRDAELPMDVGSG